MKEWKTIFHKNILAQGKEYYERGRVFELKEKQGVYTATVVERKTYAVRIIAKDNGSYKVRCKCPFAKGGGNCRHMAAVLYAVEAGGTAENARKDNLESRPESEVNAAEAKEERLNVVKGMKTENPRVMEAMEPEAESTYNIEEIGEGEYFILDSSGLNKKIPKQREETNPAIQEPYSYFDFKKIWEPLKGSEKRETIAGE